MRTSLLVAVLAAPVPRGLHREHRQPTPRRRRQPARARPSSRPTTPAASPAPRRRRARSPSTSPTPARRSPSSTCSPRTGCGSSPRSRTSAPDLTRELDRQRARRHVLHRLQAGHEGRRASAPTSPSPSPATRPPAQRRRAAARRRRPQADYARLRPATSPTSCSPRPRQFVAALQGRRRRRRPDALPRGAHPLGADRDRRGVLRRPRPEDGRPRGRPRARPGVDRLAPASRRTCGRRAPRTTPPLTPRSGATYADDLLANTQTLDDRVAGARLTPSTRSPTARAACSRRSPPARSPARRSTGRAPTCGTSRPTSTARASAYEGLEPILERQGPRARRRRSTARFDDAPGAARRAARRRRASCPTTELTAGPGQAALRRRQRARPSRCRG